MQERTFFYVASEAYRQVWGYPVTGDVPSAAFKATIPASSPRLWDRQRLPGTRSENISDALHAGKRPGRSKLREL